MVVMHPAIFAEHAIRRRPTPLLQIRTHLRLRPSLEKSLLRHHGVPVVASTADQRVWQCGEALELDGGRKGKRNGSVAVE
jgi:hypothetical protein